MVPFDSEKPVITEHCPDTEDDTTSHHWVPRRGARKPTGERHNVMVCKNCGITYGAYLDLLGLR